MAQRWWYLRRAVPWTVLLGCCLLAGVVGLLLERWPTTALLLLPALLASCAAAACFAFDEVALPVVEVTPRGATWRRVARLATVAVPLATWTTAVLVRPGDLPLDRSAWWTVGAAALLLAVGSAAWASRAERPRPGGALASAAALALIGPLVVSGFLGSASLYPFDGLGTGAVTVWATVTAAGLVVCVVALRPGLRR